jgi:hypothetical protein
VNPGHPSRTDFGKELVSERSVLVSFVLWFLLGLVLVALLAMLIRSLGALHMPCCS